MKKLFFLFLLLLIGFYVKAQQTKVPACLINKSERMISPLDGSELPFNFNAENPYVKSKPAKDLGIETGTTLYDLQSNSNNGNRIILKPDGNYSAVWTMSHNDSTNWTDMGSGYNHSSDGGYWWSEKPTNRIEGSIKTGWPNIGPLSDGTEVVVSHKLGNSKNIGNLCKSSNGGISWVNSTFGDSVTGLQWTRMITNGNTIHVIGHSDTNIPFHGFSKGVLVYYRSTDGGTNWSAPVVPTGLDTANYANTDNFAENYSIAGNGDTIAIVYGNAFRTPCLIKSTDNGTTWSYKEILHFPPAVKKFNTEGNAIFDVNNDGFQDNIYSDDGCNFVTLDKYGKAHVFFGRMKYTDNGEGAGYNYFPFTDGLYYWNEDMGTINYQYKWSMIDSINTYEAIPDTINFPIITSILDINGNDTIDLPNNGSNLPFGPYYCSLSSQPAAAILNDGSILLFYSSIVEGTNGLVGTEHRAFRNIWEIHRFSSNPNNFIWSMPIRIAEDDFTEAVYPCITQRNYCDGSVLKSGLWYQGDAYPGIALKPVNNNPHPFVENSIYYVNLHNLWFCEQGINKINDLKLIPVIYPNPASNNVNISFKLTSLANINISIYNTLGQRLMTTSKHALSGNMNIDIDIKSLQKGIYIIISTIGNETFTNKLVIE